MYMIVDGVDKTFEMLCFYCFWVGYLLS